MKYEFWHLADKNSLIFHNAPLSNGYVPSISMMAIGELSDCTTPYAALTREHRKEAILEEVRARQFDHLPSRFKSFNCFASRPDAERASHEWFSGHSKEFVRLSIVEGAKLHVGDSKLLDAYEDAWEDMAQQYWSGAITENPLLEIIVHGCVYFPDWQSPQFSNSSLTS